MCLASVHYEIKRKEIIEKLKLRKDKYMTVYKIFAVGEGGNLLAVFKNYQFYEGKNTAEGEVIFDIRGSKSYTQYKPGFHSFLNRKGAEKWKENCNFGFTKSSELVVYPVRIRKSWITTVGWQGGQDVIVSKHIVI